MEVAGVECTRAPCALAARTDNGIGSRPRDHRSRSARAARAAHETRARRRALMTAPLRDQTLRDQALRGALMERADLWKAAAARARRLMSGRAKDVTDATRMVDDYR